MKSILVSVMLMGFISTGLCIKCYVGVGDVGASTVKEVDGFTTCTLARADAGGMSIATRAGLKTEVTAGCNDQTVLGAKTTQCNCNTDLCNSAPAAVHALMPIIVMALLVKFII